MRVLLLLCLSVASGLHVEGGNARELLDEHQSPGFVAAVSQKTPSQTPALAKKASQKLAKKASPKPAPVPAKTANELAQKAKAAKELAQKKGNDDLKKAGFGVTSSKSNKMVTQSVVDKKTEKPKVDYEKPLRSKDEIIKATKQHEKAKELAMNGVTLSFTKDYDNKQRIETYSAAKQDDLDKKKQQAYDKQQELKDRKAAVFHTLDQPNNGQLTWGGQVLIVKPDEETDSIKAHKNALAEKTGAQQANEDQKNDYGVLRGNQGAGPCAHEPDPKKCIDLKKHMATQGQDKSYTKVQKILDSGLYVSNKLYDGGKSNEVKIHEEKAKKREDEKSWAKVDPIPVGKNVDAGVRAEEKRLEGGGLLGALDPAFGRSKEDKVIQKEVQKILPAIPGVAKARKDAIEEATKTLGKNKMMGDSLAVALSAEPFRVFLNRTKTNILTR